MLLLLLSCFSRVRLCATLETAAHQAPPSLGFSRQEHWSGLPFPSPSLHLPISNLQGGSLDKTSVKWSLMKMGNWQRRYSSVGSQAVGLKAYSPIFCVDSYITFEIFIIYHCYFHNVSLNTQLDDISHSHCYPHPPSESQKRQSHSTVVPGQDCSARTEVLLSLGSSSQTSTKFFNWLTSSKPASFHLKLLHLLCPL